MHWLPVVTALGWVSQTACSSLEQSPLALEISDLVSTKATHTTSQTTSAAASYRSNLISLHKALVSTASTSGDEGDVGTFLVDYLTEHGYRTGIQFVRPRDSTPEGKERFNVIAWKGGENDDPRAKVLLTSHIDAVPPHIEYGIEEGDVTSDTRIWGRGSVDAKGSVAAMIIALEELQAKKSQVLEDQDVMMLFVVGEEVMGEGMIAFSDSLEKMPNPPNFETVIFGEPTENKLACGHKGGLFCDVRAKGIGGHSGYPWLGKSANEVMIRALSKILDTDLGSSKEYGNTTVNIGRFDGGVAQNVIAELAVVSLAIRVALGPEKEGGQIVEKQVRRILEEVDSEAFEMTCGDEPYGFVGCDCNMDDFETIVVNYGTDIPHLTGDHRRYLYGPGTILVAHGPHENLTVSDLETAVEDYQKLILHALKKSSSEPLSEDL